jgi:hypothetical protein
MDSKLSDRRRNFRQQSQVNWNSLLTRTTYSTGTFTIKTEKRIDVFSAIFIGLEQKISGNLQAVFMRGMMKVKSPRPTDPILSSNAMDFGAMPILQRVMK